MTTAVFGQGESLVQCQDADYYEGGGRRNRISIPCRNSYNMAILTAMVKERDRSWGQATG
jgi:hypothetical protein